MRFRDEYQFLSNMAHCPAGVYGYPTLENYFQAMKSTDQSYRAAVRRATPQQAKRLGRGVQLRPDWLDIRMEVMRTGVERKFEVRSDFGLRLRQIDDEIVEHNHWHDNFWGSCVCPGCETKTKQNHLGRLLQDQRNVLRGC